MSNQNALLYLFTILEAIEKIKIYCQDITTADELFTINDQMNFNAISRLLLTIGEEVQKIDVELLHTQPHIYWQEIKGLRNRMAHDYRGIDPDIVFDIAVNELEILKKALIQILLNVPINSDLFDQIIDSPYYKHIGYLKQTINFKK
jgi:uncharacterized protein with HEPN domain